MGPLRGRRHRVAVGRLALERLLDGTRPVEHAVRRQALRVIRHKGARRRADGVVRWVRAALLRGARVAPQAARAVRQQAAEARFEYDLNPSNYAERCLRLVEYAAWRA